MRVAGLLTAVAVVLTAGGCSGKEEIAADGAAAPSRVAPMQLSCGGQSFRVAFEETRAVLVEEDGQNTELPVLAASPTSEPGVTVFTNGMVSFSKQGGGDTPTVVRFARGRMAWQDCAIAVN